jgi:hypothetical protein
MLTINQRQTKKEIQKTALRTVIGPEEPFPVFSGLNKKIVNFSLRFLPALKKTRKEKRSRRNGTMKSIKDIILYSTSYA